MYIPNQVIEWVKYEFDVDIDSIPIDGIYHRFDGPDGSELSFYVSALLKDNSNTVSVLAGLHNIKESEKRTTFNVDKLEKEQIVKLQEKVAAEAQQISEDMHNVHLPAFKALSTDSELHPYLERKQVKSNYCARINEAGVLLIPVFSMNKDYTGIQQIFPNGDKRFIKGSIKQGCFTVIGKHSGNNPIYFTEGFATAATIHELTGCQVVVCFAANNLQGVISSWRHKLPTDTFILAADNDQFKAEERDHKGNKKGNTGVLTAQGLPEYLKTHIRIPEFVWSSLEHTPTDYNDLFILEGPEKTLESLLYSFPVRHEHTGFSEWKEKAKGGRYLVRYPESLAKFFLKKFNHTTVSTGSKSETFVYSEGVHTPWGDDAIKGIIQRLYHPTCVKDAERNEAFKMIKVTAATINRDFLENTEGKVNFANGVLHFKEKRFGNHSPLYGFTSKLKYNYDAEAINCPIFDQFLKNITLGDKGLQAILKEYVGWILSGDNYMPHERFMILHGGGMNGKSTFTNLVKALVGDAQYTSADLEAMNNGNMFESAQLSGKLCCVNEEAKKNIFEETSILKKLTGGTPINVQEKHKAPYELQNKAKFIITYNTMPHLGDLSVGMSRRALIVPFNMDMRARHKDKKIPDIINKLNLELPAIFNKCLDTYLAMDEFTICEAMNEAYNDLEKESSPMLQWIDEYCEFSEKSELKFDSAYRHYNQIMEEGVAERFKLSQRGFKMKLKKLLENKFKLAVARPNKKGVSRIYVAKGIKLSDAEKSNFIDEEA